MNIQGLVRNLRDGSVEVIIKGSAIEEFYERLSKLKSDKMFDIDTVERSHYYYPDIEQFNDFRIERGDDLSEMVLALRGAGIKFKESAEILKKINNQKGRLLTLHHELVHNKLQLEDVKRFKDGISSVALSDNIKNPALPEDNFIFSLCSVFFSLAEVKQTPNSESIDINIHELLQDIDSLDNIIAKELDDMYGIKSIVNEKKNVYSLI
jgi:hypothetical protein